MDETVVIGASTTGVRSGSGARKVGFSRKKTLTAYLFLLPWIIGVVTFFAYPILSSIYYSFTRYDVLTPARWVGFQNFAKLPEDRYFRQALTNTLIYVAVAVPGALVTGFIQALLLNAKVKGQQIFRTLALVPGTVPVAASAAVWLYILTPGDGLINSLLLMVGLPRQSILANPAMVKWAFVGMTIVWGSGMLVFLAGLQGVPESLYEAAQVDGATALQKFRHVTIPMMTPSILFNLLMGMIGAFQYFAFPMLMTEGGPVGGSTFFGQYLYQSAFEFWKMGYASAQAWILFLVCVVVVFFIFRSSARWVYYETE